MFIVSCIYSKIKSRAKMGLFYASKGWYPSFLPEIYHKFPCVNFISNSSSTIVFVIYLHLQRNNLTFKIVRLLIQ